MPVPFIQSYACIDLSGSVQGSNNVDQVVLNDAGVAAFGFQSGDTYTTYQFTNGQPNHVQDLELHVTGGGANGSIQEIERNLLIINSQGTIYGREHLISGEFESNKSFACRNGVTIPLLPPDPPYGPGEDGLNSVFCYHANDSGYCGTASGYTPNPDDPTGGSYNLVIGGVICCGGSTIQTGTLESGNAFMPVLMNNTGSAIGSRDNFYSGILTFRNGITQALVDFETEPSALNDQNQIVCEWGGYLWEDGKKTILVDHLPASLKDKIVDIRPYAISNQTNPAPGPDRDVTIYILAWATVNGVADVTIVCARDNDGDWSYEQVGVPVGTTTSRCTTINSSGSIAFIGNIPSANRSSSSNQAQAPSPSPTQRAGIASPVDISLTFGYPNPVNGTRATIDRQLARMPGIQPGGPDLTDDEGNPDPNGDVKTYHYKIEGGRGKKTWTIQTSSNQRSFIKALETVPYVFCTGHANCGAGIALKANSAASDLARDSIRTVDDFMHLRNPRAAIPWKDFQVDGTEYQWFAQNAIAENQIEQQPTNYRVNMTGFSAPLLNGDGDPDNERFPNIAHPNQPYPTARVQPGQLFTLQSTSFPDNPGIPIPQIAMNCMHFWGRDQDGHVAPFVIVKLANEIKPNFGYKILLLDVCNGARDYSEVFRHGCFISTTDLTQYDESIPLAFVNSLMRGNNKAQVLRDIITQTHHDDFTEKDY